MKFFLKLYYKKAIALAIAIFFLGLYPIFGQGKPSIQGTITDLDNECPISYATVSLHNAKDSSLVTGTVSNDQGYFKINAVPNGQYYLRVSFIGYQPEIQLMDFTKGSNFDTGKIMLKQSCQNIEEAVVTAERIRAKTTENNTTFFINKNMQNISNTGVDLLKHLPGIQVDLLQNLTLEGSQNIIILVDGKERDLSFVSQINAKQIDKVEIIRNPGSKYDAHVTGVLNIILKEREYGISGHIYTDIPTAKKQIFLNPSYSLNYGTKKLNLYTSYNGEMRYFDITEKNIRKLHVSSGSRVFQSELDVRQKTWKHRFHYGVDFFVNPRNQFNFYSFFNPYSQELDGSISMQSQLENLEKESAQTRREEKDRNYQAYYSLYYKYLFNRKGQEICFDFSYFDLNTENTIRYDYQEASSPTYSDIINSSKPRQHTANLRIDFTSPISQTIRLDAGLKSHLKSMKDRNTTNFNQQENTHAAHAALSYCKPRIQINIGLRAENSSVEQNHENQNKVFALLPNARINLQINKKQKMQLTYRRSINRPNIYQLNPNLLVIDPFTVQRGNPNLEPAFQHRVALDYTILPGNNYLSTQVFYSHTSNAILHLSLVNDFDQMETQIANLGDIRQYGVQWTGALKLSTIIGFSPYFKLFRNQTTPNGLARQYGIELESDWAYEFGLSGTANFKKNFGAALQLAYNSPTSSLQNHRYSDLLYFLSVEKTFKKNLNIGISTAIPFVRKFTYSGITTQGENLYSHTEGNIHISSLPITLHVRYQFNKGKKVKPMDRDKEKTEEIIKKGF